MKFRHKIFGFTPVAMLATVGVTPQTHGIIYQSLLLEVTAILETQVMVTAERLNFMLKEAYRKDMFDIEEYIIFSRYIDVMILALSSPFHTAVYVDARGLIQARFVDTDLLGNLGDLQRIQRMVYPAGSLRGWIGIYKSWLFGKSKKYEDTVNQRLDIMSSERIAPFWELIEYGNGYAAYPQNPPKRTLTNFRSVYNREMRAAYARSLSAIRIIALRPSPIFIGYKADTVTVGGKTYFGHRWKSITGKSIFAISGTTAIDKFGHLTGKGFMLDVAGVVLRRWSGWLPR